MYANLFVYPTLPEMNRIIPRLQKGSIVSTGDTNVDFGIGVFLLIVIIGGGCNILAFCLTKRYVYGFSTASAASLAYYQRITMFRQSTLFYVLSQPVTAAGAYWSSLALMAVQNQHDWFPSMVAWLAAGCAGSVLAKYHLENVSFFGDVLQLFGLA
jgi:hypothetical protein